MIAFITQIQYEEGEVPDMKRKTLSIFLWDAILLALLIGLDQFTKYLVQTHLYEKSVDIVKGIFALTYSTNTGAAWGILSGKVDFFIVVCVVLLFVISFFLFRCIYVIQHFDIQITLKKKFIWIQCLFIFLLSGACGNLIDRIRLRYVIDFLDFKLIQFPIFNVADCYVSVSVLFLGFLLLSMKDEELSLLMPAKNIPQQ